MGNTISGIVFDDLDYAGTPGPYQAGDAPLPNVEVELYDATDTHVQSVSTSASGQYTFYPPGSGSYKVRVRSATIGALRRATSTCGCRSFETTTPPS